MKFAYYLEMKWNPKSTIIHARRGDEYFQQETLGGLGEEHDIAMEKLKDQIIAAHGFINAEGEPLTVDLVGGEWTKAHWEATRE